MTDTRSYLGINIDESRTSLLPTYSQDLIRAFYCKDSETIQEAFARASVAWADDSAHAQRLYDGCSQRHFMWSSPAFSNAPLPGEKVTSMPASCFLPYVDDNIGSLLMGVLDFSVLSVIGGGVGQYFNVRHQSKKSPGPIPFIRERDTAVLAWKQGTTRRGAQTSWIHSSSPSAKEFMKIRTPTGDNNRKAENINIGFSMDDKLWESVRDGVPTYDLIDPHTKKVTDTVNPLEYVMEIITERRRTGEPFGYMVDTANRYLPACQKALGLRTYASNLCTEVTLAQNDERTAVCFLSSLNAEMHDQWAPTLVADLVRALDNIVQFFIDNVMSIADRYTGSGKKLIQMVLEKARFSAERERSIGLGVMGFDYALKKNNLIFGSPEAREWNIKLFKDIKAKAVAETLKLGDERGAAPDAIEAEAIIGKHEHSGRRNLHLLAIAPNANSAHMLGTSPSIELSFSNIYTADMRIGMFEIRDPYLKKVLASRGMDTEEVWDSIVDNDGHIDHLDCLTDHEKQVFRTTRTVPQLDVVRMAADRQPDICQAQSLNLAFAPDADVNDVFTCHYKIWEWGLKSWYYYRTETDVKIEKLSSTVKAEKLQDGGNTIYGTAQCPNCNTAKRLMEANGLTYEYVDLKAVGKTAAEVTGDPGCRSVPQIFIEGKLIGGLDKLQVFLSGLSSNTDCVSCEA